MNKDTSQKTDKKLWAILGPVVLIGGISLLYLFNINNPVSQQQSITPVTCTDFQYSDWSHCSKDGEQSRTITNAFPLGCSGGEPIQIQSCEYKSVDYGTAPEILNRIVNQINVAPNKTINSSYISGESGELLTKLSYQIIDNSLVIRSTIIHRDTNMAEPTMDFIDSNMDGFVDSLAQNNNMHNLDKDSQEYSQFQAVWGIYLVNFANYHLIK